MKIRKKKNVYQDYRQHRELIDAVIEQLGGWKEFKGYAPDIYNYGVNGGFSGFIYYTDTIKFFNDNKKAIMNLATEQYREFGYKSMLEMFSSMFKGYTEQDILEGIYEQGEYEYQVKNGLAWYAAEEVCRMFIED